MTSFNRPDRTKWTTLDNAYVNFTHFARIKEESNGWSFTKYGIFHAWRRHLAYFMGGRFPCIDLLIPLAYADSDDYITPDIMSYMVISMKNRTGTNQDSLSEKSIDEASVLGTPNGQEKYVKPSSQSSLNLALRTLAFIHHDSKSNPIDGEVKEWIEITERNPYIAFVMSFDSGSIRDNRRFIAETQVFEY